MSVLKHIHEFWPKGCRCVACRAVDNREDIVVK
jgi:hypothetical protein